MHLRPFGDKIQRRDRRQPNEIRLESGNTGPRRRAIAPAGAEVMHLRENEAEWPWWLSSRTTEAATSDRDPDDEADLSRRWALRKDEEGKPTSLPAA